MGFLVAAVVFMAASVLLVQRVAQRFGIAVDPRALVLCAVMALIVNFSAILLSVYLTFNHLVMLVVMVIGSAALVTGVNEFLLRREYSHILLATEGASEDEPTEEEGSVGKESEAGGESGKEEESAVEEPKAEDEPRASGLPSVPEEQIVWEVELPPGAVAPESEPIGKQAETPTVLPIPEPPPVEKPEAAPISEPLPAKEPLFAPILEKPIPEPEPVLPEPKEEPKLEPIVIDESEKEPEAEPEPEPVAEEPEAEPEPEPVAEEPKAEPEPEPVEEEPETEPEPEPVAEEPEAEPEEPEAEPEPEPVAEEPETEPEPEPVEEEPETAQPSTLDDYLDRAYAEKDEGHSDEAAALYREAIDKFSDDPYVPFLVIELGNLYKDTGKYADAVETYRRAREIPIIQGQNDIMDEFRKTIAYLDAVSHITARHGAPSIQYNKIPPDWLAEIEKVFAAQTDEKLQ